VSVRPSTVCAAGRCRGERGSAALGISRPLVGRDLELHVARLCYGASGGGRAGEGAIQWVHPQRRSTKGTFWGFWKAPAAAAMQCRVDSFPPHSVHPCSQQKLHDRVHLTRLSRRISDGDEGNDGGSDNDELKDGPASASLSPLHKHPRLNGEERMGDPCQAERSLHSGSTVLRFGDFIEFLHEGHAFLTARL
jgi:hypothetical protein